MSNFKPNQPSLNRMIEMGIHPAMAEQALQMTNNNLDQAIMLIVQMQSSSVSRADSPPPKPPVSKKTGNPICHMCRSESTEITQTKLMDFGCGHKCCQPCLSKHCQNLVERRRRSYVMVPCTFEKCDQFCPISIVEEHLTPKGREFVQRMKKSLIPVEKLPKDPCPRNFCFPLKDFGYHYDDKQQFRHIETGETYYYINERHYIAIGDSIVRNIQKVLMEKYNLKEYFCDSKKISNIFRSENGHDKLMIIIQGSGAVRPGQWARGLCMNESLHTGACIDYVDMALKQNYDVILLNPNLRKVRKRLIPVNERFNWTDPKKPGSIPDHEAEVIENCESGTRHTLYVYNKFIKPLKHVKHYTIVAHSAGGYHTMELLRSMVGNSDFYKKLVTIGFTDSVHSISYDEHPKVRDFVTKNAVNWAKSREDLDTLLKRRSRKNCLVLSAGHMKHENTSASCMKSLFRYFGQELEKRKK